MQYYGRIIILETAVKAIFTFSDSSRDCSPLSGARRPTAAARLVSFRDCVSQRRESYARAAIVPGRVRGATGHSLARVNVLLLYAHGRGALGSTRCVPPVRRRGRKRLAMRGRRVLSVRRHGRQAGATADMGRSSRPRRKALRLGKLSHRPVVHGPLSNMLHPGRIGALSAILARVPHLTRIARVSHVAHLAGVTVVARIAGIAVIARRRDRRRSRVETGSRAARAGVDLSLPFPHLALSLSLLIVALFLVAIIGTSVTWVRRGRWSLYARRRVVRV